MTYTLTRNDAVIGYGLSRKGCLVLMERIKQLAQSEPGHDIKYSGCGMAQMLSVGSNLYVMVPEHG